MSSKHWKQAEAFLNKTQVFGVKLGLERLQVLLDHLGNPEKAFPALHIAGTNGKGSCSITSACLSSQIGLKTGLYTSPYIERFTERIRIFKGGENVETLRQKAYGEISEDRLADLLIKIQNVVEAPEYPADSLPSYFELLTAAAFLYFAEEKCDLVICEVGLGGRLDATNSLGRVQSSVITALSYDHTQYLGEDIASIAREKAGILREKIPLILYDPSLALPSFEEAQAAYHAVEEVARKKCCPFYCLGAEHVKIFNNDEMKLITKESLSEDMTYFRPDEVADLQMKREKLASPVEVLPPKQIPQKKEVLFQTSCFQLKNLLSLFCQEVDSNEAEEQASRKTALDFHHEEKTSFYDFPSSQLTAPSSELEENYKVEKTRVLEKKKFFAELCQEIEGEIWHLRLLGEHQCFNAALALLASLSAWTEMCFSETMPQELLLKLKTILGKEKRQDLKEAIQRAFSSVTWPARLECLYAAPLFLYDGAHNPSGAKVLRKFLLRNFQGQTLDYLCGMLEDKDYTAMLQILLLELPYTLRTIYCLSPDNPRKLEVRKLAAHIEEELRKVGIASKCYSFKEFSTMREFHTHEFQKENAEKMRLYKDEKRDKMRLPQEVHIVCLASQEEFQQMWRKRKQDLYELPLCAWGSLYLASDIKHSLQLVEEEN